MLGNYIDDWLNSLDGPDDPPFHQGTCFEDESSRFIRVLVTSGAITAAVLGLNVAVSASTGSDIVSILFSSQFALRSMALIALFAVLYAMLSRALGIRIGFKQAFYVFGFTVAPWVPILAAVVAIGRHPSFWIFYFLGIYLVPAYIVVQTANGISIVTGRKRSIAMISLLVPVLMAIGGALWLC